MLTQASPEISRFACPGRRHTTSEKDVAASEPMRLEVDGQYKTLCPEWACRMYYVSPYDLRCCDIAGHGRVHPSAMADPLKPCQCQALCPCSVVGPQAANSENGTLAWRKTKPKTIPSADPMAKIIFMTSEGEGEGGHGESLGRSTQTQRGALGKVHESHHESQGGPANVADSKTSPVKNHTF